MKLLLARHGQTDWNKEGRYQGITDIRLNKEGLHQAKLLAERLKNQKIDAIYCSKLSRARQTASLVAAGHGISVVAREDLNERSYGKWDGLTEEEIRDSYGEDFAQYLKDRYHVAPTKGESIQQVRARVQPFLDMIRNDDSDKILLLVCHGGTLRGLVAGLLAYTPEEVAVLRFKQTSLTSISIHRGITTLDFINSIDHLGGNDEEREDNA